MVACVSTCRGGFLLSGNLSPSCMGGKAFKSGAQEPEPDTDEDGAVLRPMTAAQIQAAAQGMILAGRPLQPPRLHRTDWKVGQRFTSAQDPDRTLEPWRPPRFLKNKDPVLQREKVQVEELELLHLPAYRRKDAMARIVRNVLDEEDCAELIAHVNRKGFTPALLNVGGGDQELDPMARDGHRVIVDSPDLTHWLFEVLRPHLPEQFGNDSLLNLNERCRFLCYTPGQYFAPHHDGCFVRPPNHMQAGAKSRVTVQLYLHDVDASAGGATNFLTNRDEVALRTQPAAGSALLFTQDLYHEGDLLQSGLKYTLRTEAMYGKMKAEAA